MFEKLLKERILLEGNSPELALARLQKAEICLYRIKKIKKNQILFTVSKKDGEKVFAIYPNMCYNKEDKKAYTAKRVRTIGAYRWLTFAQKRWGAILGAAAFLFATACSDTFVLRVSFVGATAYREEATEILERYGVKRLAVYPKGREEEIAAELLKIKGITFASIRKSGTVARVELRASPFRESTLRSGDMTARHTGVLTSAIALRGTLLKKTGETVFAGEPIVGGYFIDESGGRTEVCPIARVTLRCTFEEFYVGGTEEEGFAKALLFTDGTILERKATARGNGYVITVVYEATESVNF